MFEWTIVWVMLIKYRYRYMTSEFICCFCSRWTNPICFIHVFGHENIASWLYQRMFMSLQCVMALLTDHLSQMWYSGDFPALIYCLYLYNKFSIKFRLQERESQHASKRTRQQLPRTYTSRSLLRFKEILSSLGMATKLMRR